MTVKEFQSLKKGDVVTVRNGRHGRHFTGAITAIKRANPTRRPCIARVGGEDWHCDHIKQWWPTSNTEQENPEEKI